MISENTPRIETERLILRKFTKNDLQSFIQIMIDEDVNTFLPWFPVKTLEEAEDFLNRNYFSYYDKPSAYRYAICLRKDDNLIGYACLSDDDSHDFGYGLKKEFWNQGITTEASKAIIHKIKDAGFSFITATHDIKNIGSGKVMKKLGMAYRYSYVEQWQPKDISVTFRLYQLNFDGKSERTYWGYWDRYSNHFIEQNI